MHFRSWFFILAVAVGALFATSAQAQTCAQRQAAMPASTATVESRYIGCPVQRPADTVNFYFRFDRYYTAANGGGFIDSNYLVVTAGDQPTCGAGFVYNATSKTCVVDTSAACTASNGKTSIVNVTVGYARSKDMDDLAMVGPVTKTPPGTSLCEAGCTKVTQSASPSTPGVAAWRSMVPTAQGLYRLSLDLPATSNGVSCTGTGTAGNSDAAVNPLQPDVPCPGYIGEVNGVKGCYGTASKPVVTSPADRPPVESVAANPAAGAAPVSGAGSGTTGTARTPSAGTGGSAGGPSGAAIGGPKGTASAPASGEVQQECGAPGQPRCRIDESGTPAEWKPTELNSHADKYKKDVDAARDTVSGSVDKTFFSGWSAAFFAPPIAECTPFQLPRDMGALDPCPVAAGMRSVMGWIWAVGGLLLCLRMIKKVV